MNLKLLLTCLVLITLADTTGCDCGQEANGIVIDAETQAPIPGVRIEKVNREFLEESMADGRLEVIRHSGGIFRCGPTDLVFQKKGYREFRIETENGEEQTIPLTRVDQATKTGKLQTGDIIFQISQSSQSKAIQLATHSPYSHMGILEEIDGEFSVFEAIQPVTSTPLEAWIHRGENGHYVVKRLKNADQILTPSVLAALRQSGEQYVGKPYDLYFEWTDDRIYCSELVWKIYQEATGIEIGQLEKLSDFDLQHEAVRSKLAERFGEDIPLEETVISPAAMFNSDKLVTIRER